MTFIPQASNIRTLTRTLDVLLWDGVKTTSEVAAKMGTDARTAGYYLASAVELGLATQNDAFEYKLTSIGVDASDDTLTLARQIAGLPAVKAFKQGADIFLNLCTTSGLSSTTAKRRMSAVKAWSAFSAIFKPAARKTHCPNCHIALPALVKAECDTCGIDL